MEKIVRLTESDLARIVRRVLNEEMEQENSGGDRDWWNLDLAPKLKAAGFVSKTDPEDPSGERPCYYKCCTYMHKGRHETGTNVFLDCGPRGQGEWKIIVYNKGNQNKKSFDAGKAGAEAAVKYALSLG